MFGSFVAHRSEMVIKFFGYNSQKSDKLNISNIEKNEVEVKKKIDKLIQEQNTMNEKMNDFYFDNQPCKPGTVNEYYKSDLKKMIPEKFNLNNEPKIEINDRLDKLNQSYMNDITLFGKSNYSNDYLNHGKLSISEPNVNSSKLYNHQLMNQRMSQLNPIGRNIQGPVELEIKTNLYNVSNSKKKFKDVYHNKMEQLKPLPLVANTNKNFYNNLNGINKKPIDARNSD